MSDIGNRMELERHVIGWIIQNSTAMTQLPPGFSPDDFETKDYRMLFEKIHSVFVEEGNVDRDIICRKHPEVEPLVRDILSDPIDLKERFEQIARMLSDHSEVQDNEVHALRFRSMTSDNLKDILGLTIKHDEVNKLFTFLVFLSAFTENSQMNASYNAPSSTGKTYIPVELARLFPIEDVLKVGYCSPTAFFHSYGKFNKEKEGYIVDLSRKILIFLDQPHLQLLQHLRPLLSHDEKEILVKITDKSQKFGLKTKNIYLIGFPAVVFCTAGLKIDEQESTRFILLSPETTEAKIREGIEHKIRREADSKEYDRWLDEHPGRRLLKARMEAIKGERIEDIKIGSPELVQQAFFERTKVLKPRHQRDIGRVIGLVKTFALLNFWYREREGNSIISNGEDIREAFAVWDSVWKSQELNLPPYIYQIFTEVILPAFAEKTGSLVLGSTQGGLGRKDIIMKHAEVYGRPLADWSLRQQIIPMLESSGLIIQEPDLNDKRRMLIYPTT